jgi:hypothetical protein
MARLSPAGSEAPHSGKLEPAIRPEGSSLRQQRLPGRGENSSEIVQPFVARAAGFQEPRCFSRARSLLIHFAEWLPTGIAIGTMRLCRLPVHVEGSGNA